MKWFGNISILIAGSLLVLHSILPHSHHDEMTGVERFVAHKEAENVFDYLEEAFHFSPGQNHLEEYQLADYFTINDILPVHVEWSILSQKIEEDSKYLTYFEVSSKEYFPDNQFRGPPNRF